MNHQYVERVVDLLEPGLNRIHNMSVEDARARILAGDPDDVLGIDGSFSLIAKEGKTVRMARSLDRPMRYFLAKRHEGPALVVADRMDAIYAWLKSEGFADQFHPSYTRMVPAHHIVEIQLIGCPDPDPVYTRFFDPKHDTQPGDVDTIGRNYIGALANEIEKWLSAIDDTSVLPAASRQSGRGTNEDSKLPASCRQHDAPIGVCFSGGIDSGAVFLTTYHVMLKRGMNPSRLKAFTLSLGGGDDLKQSREFLRAVGLELFLEAIEARPDSLNLDETLRILEDYKPLDVECAAMGIALLRGIRERYPDWKFMLDGDGGDENLKDYPIEENPELTIRSVLHNQMLYQEGWGVGKIKHSLTYSGGLSRGYLRTYAPARQFGFDAFSPFVRPSVMAVAEGIPFIAITNYDHTKLYDLKGAVVASGIKQLTGFDMPVYPKRRFQHGAVKPDQLKSFLRTSEPVMRRRLQELFVS
ncbi:asparagine synthetase B family protein [bacterium]|nr:asparagine synthetase B family protein [bacterium]